MSIAPEGWPFVLAPLAAAAALLALGWTWPAVVLALLGAFSAFFFRDPERMIPPGQGVVVSPADGKVIQVMPAPDDNPLGTGANQVSIFLSLLNVHVNRAPIGGRIVGVEYRRGEFLPAFNHLASTRNEQNTVTLEDLGTRVVFKQIAGILARRIVFRKRPGDGVALGERVGLIRFGSRVDLFLPPEFAVRVAVGDRVRGGASVLAERE
jgi:phosphatidylserine decarboxylase